MFAAMGVMFIISSVLFFAVFIIVFVKCISAWNKNNNSPRLTVPATIVEKSQRYVSRGMGAHDDHTSYYITFQVESGDRMSFLVPWPDYGILVEGDTGRLTFQGTRYLSFDRDY